LQSSTSFKAEEQGFQSHSLTWLGNHLSRWKL
jgi:hypothetical protein